MKDFWESVKNYDYVGAGTNYLACVSVLATAVSLLIKVVFGLPVFVLMYSPDIIEFIKIAIQSEMKQSKDITNALK